MFGKGIWEFKIDDPGKPWDQAGFTTKAGADAEEVALRLRLKKAQFEEGPGLEADVAAYKDMTERLANLYPGSAEYKWAQEKIETIKNRHGGMPPKLPAPAEAPKVEAPKLEIPKQPDLISAKGMTKEEADASWDKYQEDLGKYLKDIAEWEKAQPANKPIIFKSESGLYHSITPNIGGGWRTTSFSFRPGHT
jgi:hypothetical protein